jgi:hypothetical protein
MRGLALADLHDDFQSCDRRNRAGKLEIAAGANCWPAGIPEIRVVAEPTSLSSGPTKLTSACTSTASWFGDVFCSTTP